MTETAHARPYAGPDGPVRAMRYDGRTAGYFALLAAFPGRVAPHPHRDDAVLVGERRTRVEAGDWVTEGRGGPLRTWPDDQFHILHTPAEATPA